MRIDHIGVAVTSIDEAARFYAEGMGLAVLHREEVPEQKVRVAFLGDASDPGGAEVELLEPTDPEGPVGRSLAARGPGLHHLAFRARDLSGEMRRLAGAGWPPLSGAPRPGARGHLVCFIHPRRAHGVLVELVG